MIDSFKFLPRLIATFYQLMELPPAGHIPWTPLPKPLAECTFGLVTSAGLYVDRPFDLEQERSRPEWGDPTFRVIPAGATPAVSHLHYRPDDLLSDINIQLPIGRFQELAATGRIGRLANHAYSFMGYQGYPPDTTLWRESYGPQVAGRLKAEGVDCVLLTPS